MTGPNSGKNRCDNLLLPDKQQPSGNNSLIYAAAGSKIFLIKAVSIACERKNKLSGAGALVCPNSSFYDIL